MIRKIQNFCFQNKLFLPDQSMVVGFSGGPDSTMLVYFLNRLKKSWRLKLQLVHINYGLRGEESERDQSFCQKLAKKMGLSLRVVQYNRKEEGTSNMEERLREFRYHIFEKIRKEKGYDWIAVGHVLDDQAETFLFNLMRGSGLRGLAALRPQNGRIIRPLLGMEKKEIILFLRKKKQNFCLDRTNQELIYTRNKIRQKLLPIMEKEFNPQIKRRLADLNEHLADLSDWLNEKGDEIFSSQVKKNVSSEWELDCNVYLKWPRLIRKEFFRWLIKKIKRSERNLSAANFWELEKIAFSQKSKNAQTVSGGIRIKRAKNKLFFQLDKII